jgi:peptidoglycan/LPS O-acetylase OafA/YrhL
MSPSAAPVNTPAAGTAERAGGFDGQAGERRVPGLDGLRGVATIMVIVSHYFGELWHGVRAVMFGWIAVDMFFVLSGYLIGKLIIEKCQHTNFFTVFYVRRFFRIIPAYIITVLVLNLLTHTIKAGWVDADMQFPIWSYLTFVQGFFMIKTGTIGAHWIAPTWTLAVEEHFYLLVPSLIVFAPRRALVPILVAAAVVAIGLRTAVYGFGFANEMAALTLLPARADILVCGLLAAVAMKSAGVPWMRLTPALRIAPVVALVAALVLRLIGSGLFEVLGPLLIGLGSAAFLLCIVLGTPEARRFNSRVLQFFGNNGYCLYLTHLPVLGLVHGLILGTRPDLATGAQWLVTICALPVCVLVGWGMTKLIEEPLTRYGRNWRWSSEQRSVGALQPAPIKA